MNGINFKDISSLQRYYHLVALNTIHGYDSLKLAKDATLKIKDSDSGNVGNSTFKIERAQMESNIPYYGGEGQDYSINRNQEPPYIYDVFIITLTNEGLLILGFPFKSLAKSVLKVLIDSKKLKTKATFARCDVAGLLKNSDENDMVYHDYSCYFSELNLLLLGESNLKAVTLDGDRPLDSPLFKDVFRKLINTDKCSLESCSLRGTLTPENELLPKTKSSVHIDAFGNYKFYLHRSGLNIYTLPFLFAFLHQAESLFETLSTPTDRIRNEQA